MQEFLKWNKMNGHKNVTLTKHNISMLNSGKQTGSNDIWCTIMEQFIIEKCNEYRDIMASKK